MPTNVSEYSVTLKTNWTGATVTVYRTFGGPVQLDARRAIVTEIVAHRTNDFVVTAFVDPKTRNSWLGTTADFPPDIQSRFYFETESGIYSGQVWFARGALGTVMPYEHNVIDGAEAFGEINWWGSLFPRVKRETIKTVVEQCNKNGGWKWVLAEKGNPQTTSIIEDSLRHIENGINPWFFVDEGRGQGLRVTTIESVETRGGISRLNLRSPSGAHRASVWIDPKTWKVLKVIQDGKI
ncbi:MAG: hypothetical protein ACREDS_13185 [Limisphaerales bacterium]